MRFAKKGICCIDKDKHAKLLGSVDVKLNWHESKFVTIYELTIIVSLL